MSEDEPWPHRPSVPVVLTGLACVITVSRLYLLANGPEAPLVMAPMCVWLWMIAFLCALIFALHAQSRRARRLIARTSFVCLFILAGLEVAFLSLSTQRQCRHFFEVAPVSSATFEVLKDATPTERGGFWTFGRVRDRTQRVWGLVWLSLSQELACGDVVSGVGRFESTKDDEFGLFSRLRAIAGTVTFSGSLTISKRTGVIGLMNTLRASILAALDPYASPARALIAGAALGAKGPLATFGLDDLFSQAGLSHLVAVSGLHVALASDLLGQLLLRLRCPRFLRIVSLGAWGFAYVALCGAPASAVRSVAMAFSSQLADLAGRRAHALTAVGVAGLLILCMDVGAVGDLGFLLSALCVASLGVFSAWMVRFVEVICPKPKRRRRKHWERRLLHLISNAKRTIAASMVCFGASLLLVASSFDSISILSPLSSVFVMPLFEGFLTIALACALFCSIPGVGALLLFVAQSAAQLILWLVGLFSAFPWALVSLAVSEPWPTVVTPLLLVALYCLWPRPTRAWLAMLSLPLIGIALSLWVFRPLFGGARVVVLDVGQGDAILIQDGFHAALVDTGPDESLTQALARQGVLHLDAVLLTHQHADHTGGFQSLAGRVSLDCLYVLRGQAQALGEHVGETVEALGCDLVEVDRGDVLEIGRFDLTVLWPQGPEDGDENDESLVTRLEYRENSVEFRALLTGDAENDVLATLEQAGEVGDLDFLKVGHHGSKVSVDKASARSCAPEIAVASAGEGNSYGHPSVECRNALEEAGCLFLCTKDVGDVEICPGSQGPRVRVQRNAKQES